MCVILYKPAGIDLPNKELLFKAHYHNPHGCGMCSPSVSYKGLSYREFLKRVRQVGKDEPLLIHFRLATHGSVKKANCHPFYDAETDTYFMHNGILNIRPTGDKTDSETAFDRILKPALPYGLGSDMLGYAVERVIGFSKFAFMQHGEVRLFGSFVHYGGGLWCSNLRFL